MARPRKAIDEKTLISLAEIHCTIDEIAAVVGVHKRTLERQYAAVIKAARERGKKSLRRVMWEKALDGNERLMIWLSKQHLGYREPKDDRELAAYEGMAAAGRASTDAVKQAVQLVTEIANDVARFHRA